MNLTPIFVVVRIPYCITALDIRISRPAIIALTNKGKLIILFAEEEMEFLIYTFVYNTQKGYTASVTPSLAPPTFIFSECRDDYL